MQQNPLAKLLIVDDEPAILSSMAQMLNSIGYSVRTAQDGLSALDKIREGIPDILLSDLNMPGMSGFEFLAVVNKYLPSIRVIAMSGAYSGTDVPSGVTATAYYQKGSSIHTLLKIIEDLSKPEISIPTADSRPSKTSRPMSTYANSEHGLPGNIYTS